MFSNLKRIVTLTLLASAAGQVLAALASNVSVTIRFKLLNMRRFLD